MILIGLAFVAAIVAGVVARAFLNKQDNGHVSAAWLADEKGKRKQ